MLRRSLLFSLLAVAPVAQQALPDAAGSPGASSAAGASLELGSLFGDHMVLQQRTDAPVWGWGKPGQTVEVQGSWGGAGRAVVDPGGRFLVRLPTPAAGGPFTVEISMGEQTRRLVDVLVGEVWLCSGQSNMQWPLRATDGGTEAAAAANDPRIRLFMVDRQTSATPEPRCDGEWTARTPEPAAEFSAVAQYFGLALQRELDVPVGLIGSYWGGTPCEAWTSHDSLQRRGDFDAGLAAMRELAKQPAADVGTLRASWWRGLQDLDLAQQDGTAAFAADTPLDGWEAQEVPGLWEGELARFDGVVHYARDLTLPADWNERPVELSLGAVDDMDTVFWNGVRVDGREEPGHWNVAREYRVPAELVRPGKVRIVVRIVDTGGAGGITGDADDVFAACGDLRIPLAGEWKRRVGPSMSALGAFPSSSSVSPRQPGSLYNGMIAPLLPMALAGAIWYQGESNREQAWQYRTLFPEMIHDWRRQWAQPDLPFYFVQIAPYGYDDDTGEAAELREAQLHATALPHVGMAVTMDIGNAKDIHPIWKRPVGERLAALALHDTYGRVVACRGPTYVGQRQEGRRVRLFFDHAQGLAVAAGEGALPFAIAGADRVFHPATVVVDGTTLLVSSDAVAAPVAVRYAWGAADAGCLTNGAGWPASSFRTDSWPMITAPR